MSRARQLLITCLWIAAACGGGDDDGAAAPDAGSPDATPSPPPRIVFLNREGGDYTPGPDDSAANVSTIVNEATTVPAYPNGGDDFATVSACVGERFAPFNVEVVTDDPGEVDHLEVVITTAPSLIGLDGGTASVAPFSCGVLERSIAFVFADAIGASTTEQCHVTAAAVGSMYSLEWEFECSDIMTYLAACGDKEFRDLDAPCGTTEPATCQCGGGTMQNSYQKLMSALGPAA